ncbi:MAG: ATP-binding protein [Bacillota bacterium]
MLVQFRFKNYGSFKDEVIFDMRAIKAYKEHPYNLVKEDEKTSILKVASIYGSNASGKSNFVNAYSCFLTIINSSFSGKTKEKQEPVLALNYNPFLFDEDSSEDTEFEATYYSTGSEYKYGYIYNKTRVKYEWMYKRSSSTGRQVNILERTPNKISLGPSVKSTCEKYIPDIDNDVLALSFLSSLKLRTHVFKDVLYNTQDILPMTFTCDRSVNHLLDVYFKNEFNKDEKDNLLAFLNAIDISIKDIDVKKNNNSISVYTYHYGKNQKLHEVPFEIESDGTKKAIAIYTLVRIATLYNKGLIFDELNMQLHPLLLKYFIDFFYKENTKGQLIYTTHDTTLLDKRYMRRDQIWFTSKNSDGESSLYSLAEFKIRNDESFEKEYLGGVFGAIPILKDFSFGGNESGD